MKKLLCWLTMLFFSSVLLAAAPCDPKKDPNCPPERITIKVGGIIDPPFVSKNGDYHGMTLAFINAANKVQNEYTFVFVPTTHENARKDFQSGKFSALFFKDVDWGWNAMPVAVSKPLARGTEIYITSNTSGHNQNTFKNLKERRISAIKWHHYNFAKFNNNPQYLKENFDITLRTTPDQVIQDVLSGNSEVGVISSLYLQYATGKNPELKKELLVAKKYDQDFVLSMMLDKKSPMTIETMNLLIDRMQEQDILPKLWTQYYIDPGV